MGVNTAWMRVVIFVYAAVLAAISGFLYAHLQRAVNPTPFGLNHGIEFLFMAVVGGVSHVWGAVLGAAILTVLQDYLQTLLPKLLGSEGNFEIIVFGVLMVLLLQYARRGVWPFVARLFPRGPRAHVPEHADPLPQRAKPAAGEPLLVVDNARKQFGGLVAVNDVSFDVKAGQIIGLIGPNGAGKSTTFNLVTGVLKPTGGTITFRGERIDEPHRARSSAAASADVPAREAVAGDDGARETSRSVRTCAAIRACGAASCGSMPTRKRSCWPRLRSRSAASSRKAHVRRSGQPRAGPATDSRNRAGAVLRPDAAAARRAGRRAALPGEAATRRPAAAAEGGRHERVARGTRHGFRDESHRPAGGDGIRHADRGRAAARRAAGSGGARSVSGRGG